MPADFHTNEGMIRVSKGSETPATAQQQPVSRGRVRDDGQRQEGKAGGSRAGPHVASRAGVGNTATSLHTARRTEKHLVFGRVTSRFTTR